LDGTDILANASRKIATRYAIGGPSSVFLIDANNFLFRAYHALPMLNAADGTPVNAVHGYVRMVQALRRDFAPEYLLAVFDAGEKTARNDIYAEYKAHRPPPPDDLLPQFALIRTSTEALGLPWVELPGVEADDIIACYALEAQREGKSVAVVSSDKDLMQLVDAGAQERAPIVLLDTMKQVIIGPDEVRERFGVGPERLGDLLALVGDSSDNIPGIPGIGPKTAASLLHEFGDFEGVLANAHTIKQDKRRERILEHAEHARLSRRLVTLVCDIPLPLPFEQIRDHGPDSARCEQFFAPLGFKMVLRELGIAARTEATAPAGERSTTSERAIELLPIADFTIDGSRCRALLRANEAELIEFVTSSQTAHWVVFDVIALGEDAMRATLLGFVLGTQANDGKPGPFWYVPVGHRGLDASVTEQLSLARVLEVLRPMLESAAVPKIVDAHKDKAVLLAQHGVSLRGVAMDPTLASYALDPARAEHSLDSLAADLMRFTARTLDGLRGKGRQQIALDALGIADMLPYACERIELLAQLGSHVANELERLGPDGKRLFEDIEMPLAEVLGRLQIRGVMLDAAVLNVQGRELGAHIDQLRGRIEAEAGHAINPDSPPQLQKLLFEERGLPAGKRTKTGLSTDAKVLEELALLDPIVSLILEYRSLTKLKSTYLDSLPKLIHPETGRLHTNYRQAVAATGRISSTDPNLQNIPIRTDVGRRIRLAFVAPPGKRLVALDYSQIELRILAHLSRDPNLCSAFQEGVDVHRRTAAEVFDVIETEVTGEQRRIAKAVNFGVVYGQTAFGLAQQLGIARGKAGSYIRAYFERIPGVDRYMNELVGIAKRRGYAETLLGRRRRIPELLAKAGAARGYGERIARNTPIQGSAADILKVAMIRVERLLENKPFARMLLTVHDELIFECDEDKVNELVLVAKPAMETAVELSVALVVEVGSGRNWAECKP